ncbi:hypothetical protein BGW38_004182, partial [Lunasporangiospora selenospora]
MSATQDRVKVDEDMEFNHGQEAQDDILESDDDDDNEEDASVIKDENKMGRPPVSRKLGLPMSIKRRKLCDDDDDEGANEDEDDYEQDTWIGRFPQTRPPLTDNCDKDNINNKDSKGNIENDHGSSIPKHHPTALTSTSAPLAPSGSPPSSPSSNSRRSSSSSPARKRQSLLGAPAPSSTFSTFTSKSHHRPQSQHSHNHRRRLAVEKKEEEEEEEEEVVVDVVVLSEKTGTFSSERTVVDTTLLSLLSTTSALVSSGSLCLRAFKDGQEVAATAALPILTDPLTFPIFKETPSTLTCSPIGMSSNGNGSEHARARHWRQYCPLDTNRKRSFEEAIELARPLGNDRAMEHPGWFESNKRRKIHHFPTRWTSSLSPSPYVKLWARRDFWDVMMTRLDLSWLDFWAVSTSTASASASTFTTMTTSTTTARTKAMTTPDCKDIEKDSDRDGSGEGVCERKEMIDDAESKMEMTTATTTTTMTTTDMVCDPEDPTSPGDKAAATTTLDGETNSVSLTCVQVKQGSGSGRRSVVVQYPNPSLFLRGLWEEEERGRRARQKIPDNVLKPIRSKILNRKPIV